MGVILHGYIASLYENVPKEIPDIVALQGLKKKQEKSKKKQKKRRKQKQKRKKRKKKKEKKETGLKLYTKECKQHLTFY